VVLALLLVRVGGDADDADGDEQVSSLGVDDSALADSVVLLAC
jgi:hypothetical protein